MKRRVEEWTIDKVNKTRPEISFPEYQRQPNLWSFEKQALLIDSILQDIDIPKLYFNRTKDKRYEVVDGQQRLWSIWNFFDEEYEVITNGKALKFSKLLESQRKTIRDYVLQITIIDEVEDDYLRKLFLRLQLGLLLVTGEKLNALTGQMKDFVFRKLSHHKFVGTLKVSERRRTKETLCAQMAINSFRKAKLNSFARTRYEDLEFFFKEYEHPIGGDLEFFRDQTRKITSELDALWDCFGTATRKLSNRSYVLSVFLLFEEIGTTLSSRGDKEIFVKFIFVLWERLREEVARGMDRKNRQIYKFETMLSSAPGERYQIERRHEALLKYYDHFKKTDKILGD